jgi:hypothetical protein
LQVDTKEGGEDCIAIAHGETEQNLFFVLYDVKKLCVAVTAVSSKCFQLLTPNPHMVCTGVKTQTYNVRNKLFEVWCKQIQAIVNQTVRDITEAHN